MVTGESKRGKSPIGSLTPIVHRTMINYINIININNTDNS